jgi:molybdopterin converting factor small subunit
MVRLRFFARYAELLGCEEAMLDLPLPATIADVVRRVRDEIPGGEQLPERPMAALNQKHVRLDAAVGDGDEVAFMPPLAGG